MHLVLIPGYLAPASLLWPMARTLRRRGHQTSIFSYATYRSTLEDHAQALVSHIDSQTKGRPYALVGHSLGGLLIHTTIPLLEQPPQSLVFIATPHRGCAKAQKARKALYASFFTGAGRSTAQGVPPSHAGISTGIIYGLRDKVVQPKEALLPDQPTLALPFGHSELLVRNRTAAAVGRFVEEGLFEQELDRKKILREAAKGKT